MVPALALAEPEGETPVRMAAQSGCATVPECLALATAPDTHAERRYWAKRFLDEHPTPEVVQALAPLLVHELEKLRDLAWWYAASHEEAWKGQLPALMRALPLEPARAYLVANIGDTDAWDGLFTLARRSNQANQYAYALNRIDPDRALAFGFEVVGNTASVADPEGVIRGIFSERYTARDADPVNRRLLSLIADDTDAETRRRAALAHAVAHWSGNEMPAELRRIYASSPAPVRYTLRRHWRDLGSVKERVGDLEALFAEDDVEGLLEAERLGTAARGQRKRVLALMDAPDSRTRLFAQSTLHAIDPGQWRERRTTLLASPDISTALTAWGLDPKPTKAEVDKSAATTWYPALREAFRTREQEQARAAAVERWLELARAARAKGEMPPPHPDANGEQLVMVSNDARYADPAALACPGEGASAQRLPDSLWHGPDTLEKAATLADTSTWHLSAALRSDEGWFVGEDLGEFGGRIAFNPHGHGNAGSVTTRAEPLVLFAFDAGHYYIAGGSERSRKGVFAELGRVSVSAGTMQAQSLLTLPAPPTDVVVRDGRLLLRLEGNGWMDATNPKAPRWLGCGADVPPGE
ncbi:hypothetical protein GCM10027193_17730 [Arenimonas aestuarii]